MEVIVKRVLITGSRHVSYAEAVMIYAHMDDWLRILGPFVLVNGKCKTGVDLVTRQWALDRAPAGVMLEEHPAEDHGKWPACGPIRNGYMVSRGADMCLGYPGVDSEGTWDCMKKALKARIPIYAFGLVDEERDH